ncbi:hypothetical protein V5O48_004724 [Marasmius crinis-equi]|uniref:Cytochrome P450 n=1 Tax=Marasmius crinis-equi TaxID=585013 RepID=A0ABR3FPJ0_9AGAR
MQLIFLPLFFLTAAAAALFTRARRRSLKRLHGPPSTSWLLGHEWDMSRLRKVGSLEDSWFNRYGTAFRVAGCFGEDLLLVADPRALQHIFHKSAYRYKKPKDLERLFMKIFGPGVLTANGEVHQRQRKILNPAFSAAQIRPFAQFFSSSTRLLVSRWRAEIEKSNGSAVVDTTQWLQGMTLDALGETMFEYDFDAMEGKRDSELRDIIRDLFADTRSPGKYQMLRNVTYRFLPRCVANVIDIKQTKEDVRFASWLTRSQAVARDLAENKLDTDGEMEKGNHFLSVLARSMSTEDPKKTLYPLEALSQMALPDTRLFRLNWVLYELSRKPEYQEIVTREIKDLRERTGNEGPFSATELEGMVHLNAVIKETLRLHPIIPEHLREAAVDDVIPLANPVVDASGSELREIPITKGQRIIASTYHYNRLKQVWGEDAEEWKPERFLTNTKPTTLGVLGNLMTFGGGVRACLGWRFALLELQVVTAALVESFVFAIPKGVEIDQVRFAVTTPVVRGNWNARAQLPLNISVRQV